MGDYTYSKPKVGRSIARAKQTSIKLLSVFLAIIMVTTVFSSIVIADDQGTDPVGDNAVDDDSSTDADTTQRGKIGGIIKELINRIRENRKGLLSLGLVTRYQNDSSSEIIEKSTRMRLLLPTGIDIDGDGDNDIRVWVFRRPALDLSPPAIAWKTTILVRRLSSMDKDMINDFLEIYLEYKPRLPSKVSVDRIRMGYQSPLGEEIPKTCIVTHKNVPHFLYPRKKTSHRIGINPVSIAGKDQLNLLFSIADMDHGEVLSKLVVQVNHSPAVKNEISFDRSKDRFIRRGQTLEITRKRIGSSNVTLIIKEFLGVDSGSLTVNNIPKKISLSWLLARTGYFEIDSYGSSVGAIKAVVDGVITLGFTPETGLDAYFGWESPGLIGRMQGKGFDLAFETHASMTLSDVYVNVPSFTLLGILENTPYTLDLTASLLSLDLEMGASVGSFLLRPLKPSHLSVESVQAEVKNAELVLEDCVVDVEPVELPELPTVSIASPKDGDTVSDTIIITGTASAPEGKGIQSVEIEIDDNGEWFKAEGTETWSYKWNSETVANGVHKIEARCYDGDNYGFDSIHVTVNNVGVNWYPTVEITSPSKLVDQVVSGIVPISGTAFDKDGDDLSVTVEIYDILGIGMFNIKKSIIKEEVTVDESGNWVYDWDTTELTAGLYEIIAESYDGKDYSLESDSVQVWVRLKCILDFNLLEASVDVTNLTINGESGSLDVSSFSASGNGALKIAEDAISAEVSGSLEIDNTTISMTNESSVTTKILDNLSLDFYGYGRFLLSNPKIELNLDASLYVHADGIFESAEITFALDGTASVGIEFDKDSGVFNIGSGSSVEGNILLDITDLLFDITSFQGSYLRLGANQIKLNGTGSISIEDNSLTAEGYLDEFILDDFYIYTDIGVIYLGGDFEFSKTASLTLYLVDSYTFNLSSDKGVKVKDPYIGIRSSGYDLGARAKSIEIDKGGYVYLSYYKDDLNISCYVKIDHIFIENLTVWFDESFYNIGNISGTYEFWFNLAADDVYIDSGVDWIKIIIGGHGKIHVEVHRTFNINGIDGSIDAIVDLETGDDTFTIYLYNLSGNIGIAINGSAAVSITDLHLWIEDILDISIVELSGSFTLNTIAGSGELSLYVEDGAGMFDIDVDNINVGELFGFTLQGSIDVYVEGGASGFVELAWNESGLISAAGEFAGGGLASINITDLFFEYIDNTTAITMSADEIFIGGIGGGHAVFDCDSTLINVSVDALAGTYLEVNDLSIELTNISIPIVGTANISMTIDQIVGSGSVEFVFIWDDIDVWCNGTLSGFDIYGLCVAFNEFSHCIWSITVDGSFSIRLSADVKIVSGDDYVYIAIGGGSSAYIVVDYDFDWNGTAAGIEGTFVLENVGDVFEINLSNLNLSDPANISWVINGSAAVSITDLHLWIEDILDISIVELSGSFTLNTVGKRGELLLNIVDGVGVFDLDTTLNIVDLFSVTLQGSIDAYVEGEASGFIEVAWNESGITSFGGDFGADLEGYVDVTGLTFKLVNVLGTGANVTIMADQLLISGSGDIAFGEGYISANASIDSLLFDNVVVNSSLGNLSISGSLNLSGEGEVHLLFIQNTMFNLSVDAGAVLDISDLAIEWKNVLGSGANVTVMVDQVVGCGMVEFLFVVDDVNVTCNVTLFGLDIYGLYLAFNDLSAYVPSITADGVFSFMLSADVYIEKGDDYVYIAIGGGSSAHIVVDADFNWNGTAGGIEGTFVLENVGDVFEIYLYNLSSDIGIAINGSAVVKLSDFHVWIEDILDISIAELSGSFTLNTIAGSGELSLYVEDGAGMFDIDIDDINITNLFDITLQGSIDVFLEAGASGSINISWDESGIISADGDFGAYVNGSINITDLYFAFPYPQDPTKRVEISADLFSLVLDGDLRGEAMISTGSFGTGNILIDVSDANLVLENCTVNAMLPDGTQVTIGCTGTLTGNNSYLKAWWNETAGFVEVGCDLNISIEDFVFKVDDLVDISISAFAIVGAKGKLKLNINDKNGSISADLEECYGLVDIDIDNININLPELTLQASVDIYLEAGASGSINISWDESGIISADGDFSSYVDGSLNIRDLYFAFPYPQDPTKRVEVSADLFSIILEGDLHIDGQILPDDTGSGTLMVNLSNACLVLDNLSGILPDGTKIMVEGTFRVTGDANLEVSWNKTKGFAVLECDLNISIEDFAFKVEDLVDISVSAFAVLGANGDLKLNIGEKTGSLSLNLEESDGWVDIRIDDINIVNVYDITLQGSIDIFLEGGASGSLEIVWDKSRLISFSGDFSGYVVGSIYVKDLHFEFPSLLNNPYNNKRTVVNADLISIVLDGDLHIDAEILLDPYVTGIVVVNVSNVHLVLENCTVNVTAIFIPTPPQVEIINPSDNEEVNGTITINGTASDEYPGWVEKVQVNIDGGPWENATFDNETGEWYYIWNTTTVENGNGNYTISARAIDNEGYHTDSKPVTVIVNNSGVNWRPIVTILSPSKNNEIVSGIVTINGTASDKDGSVEKVEISIDGDEWQEVEGTTDWSYEWDTSNILFDIVTIEARSYDGEHHSSKDSVKVIVMNNISGVLEIRLLDASVEITNLNMSGPNNGTISAGYIFVSGYGEGYISLNTDRDRAEGKSGDLVVNSDSYITVEGSASLTSLVITDCYIFIPEQLLGVNITLNADLSAAGTFYINATKGKDLDIYFELYGEGLLSITDAYIEAKKETWKGLLTVDLFYLEGSGTLVAGKEGLEIDAGITNLTFVDFRLELEKESLLFYIIIVNGSLDLSFAGYLHIEGAWNMSYLEFELGGIAGGEAYVDLSDFGWMTIAPLSTREITFPGQLRISGEGNFTVGVGWDTDYKYVKLDVDDSLVSWESDIIIIKVWTLGQELLNLSIEGSGQVEVEGDIEFRWNGTLLPPPQINELFIISNQGFTVSAEFLKITVNQHELVRFEADVTILGDITLKVGESSNGVKYARMESTNGFEGNIQRIGFGDKTIELDIHIDPGSSFELQNSSALDDGLDSRVDLLFDGGLTINKFKETIFGKTKTLSIGLLEGSDGQIAFGKYNTNPNDRKIICSGQGNIVDLDFEGLTFEIAGSISIDGDIELYANNMGASGAFDLSWITQEGFTSSLDIQFNNLYLNGEMFLYPSGNNWYVIRWDILGNGDNSNGDCFVEANMGDEYNPAAETLSITTTFLGMGVMFEASTTWAEDFYVKWWPLPPDHSGSIETNARIWTTTDDGSTWYQRWPRTHWWSKGKAYDGNTDSFARYGAGIVPLPNGGWSEKLTIRISPSINCNGFRINANKIEGSLGSFDELEVKLYEGNTVKFSKTFTDWPDHGWIEHNFGTSQKVDRVKIRFHENWVFTSYNLHHAKVYEFEFLE